MLSRKTGRLNIRHRWLEVYYYINLGNFYRENPREAELCFQKAEQMLQKDWFSGYIKEPYTKAIRVCRQIVRLSCGQTDDCEACFREALAAAQTKRERLQYAFLLARTLFLGNRPEEARPLLQDVADNGNKLYIAAQAKEMLARLAGA